ncbi:MAG: circadian clock protein KaiC [Anaeromyxobacteraceae bacterium]
MARQRPRSRRLAKIPSGVRGLDEITDGGLPAGRPTLVCGAAGSGKTLLAMEFLVRGALEHGDPGVFVSFEETREELVANFASLDFDLPALETSKKLTIDYVHVDRSEIEETGEYDLEALFIRLGDAVDSIGARRLVLDSVETLFSGLSNAAILRAELRRLFRWIKERGLTAIVTGERGERTLTRHGLEEYISDCVIVLDNRLVNEIATRRMRVVKYRGSAHGSNEYPFLLDEKGLSILPVTSLGLDYPVSAERVPTGVRDLDEMLGGRGFYRNSSVLLSGSAGAGKTSFAAHFADATCRAGERCLYFAFEESAAQLARNMRSIGVDLDRWVKKGLLTISASRPTLHGLEMRLLRAHQLVEEHRPTSVVIDPISNLVMAGTALEARSMLTRLIDFLKNKGVTGVFTSLLAGTHAAEETAVEISSLIDTWVLLRDTDAGGERNRTLTIVKSRGMAHSNQSREFELGSAGISLVPVLRGAAGAITGSARLADQAELAARHAQLDRKRAALEAQIDAMRKSFAAEAAEVLPVNDEPPGTNGARRRAPSSVAAGRDRAGSVRARRHS